jgi:hypothetical protein
MENTKIEWATHTFNPWVSVSAETRDIDMMNKPMTSLADGYPIGNLKAKFRVCGERFDMVRVEIATSIIAAVNAAKPVPAHDIKSPCAAFWGLPQVFAALGLAIHKAMAGTTARRLLARLSTDQHSCLVGVLFPCPVAAASLCRCTHLGATFVGHL